MVYWDGRKALYLICTVCDHTMPVPVETVHCPLLTCEGVEV